MYQIIKIPRLTFYLLFFFSLHPSSFPLHAAGSPFEVTKDLPVAYQGRFRSLDSAARLWLYDFYHKQKLKESDLQAFSTDNASAMDLLWKIHFFGHKEWDHSPLFWVHYASVKKHLHLDPHSDHFDYVNLKNSVDVSNDAILENKENEEIQQIIHKLQIFANYEGAENPSLHPFENMFHMMQTKGIPPNEIAKELENRFPFAKRLQASGTTLKMLPSKYGQGEWLSLHAFKTKVFDLNTHQLTLAKNFTSFSNKDFFALREAYFSLEEKMLTQADAEQIADATAKFVDLFEIAYQTLAGKSYREANSKALTYPSELKLSLETMYYRLPLIEITILAYALALILMTINRKEKLSLFTLLTLSCGFLVHTTVLVLRCYILGRPPVSNMFETVIYVPWIAMAVGFIFYAINRSKLMVSAAVAASFILLVLLKLTQVDSRLENVQAVLDSQYWLIIHVLMVVGSYGAFVVCGILGHFYLFHKMLSKNQKNLENIAKGILHTMYVGVALLIPGTILGGVWAAESWGRFWDWDPKESWAFISACVYVLFIHAYTFNYIKDLGLAIGSIAGLLAISFTWYGVNYVLGTGLHSYGFGNGGESWYFLYLVSECLLIAYTLYSSKRNQFIKHNYKKTQFLRLK